MATNKWLKNVELKSSTISLIPLTMDHRDGLIAAASDGKLWELWYTGVPSANTVDQYIETALKDNEQGNALAFVVIESSSGDILGCSRYCRADAGNQRVEIGYTWYATRCQRTSLNTECKLLLLGHAFETLDAIAVEFRTHWHNLPSRNAIARLGAKQDGVLRNHSIEADGTLRDTVVFSIIESEWPAVRKSLQHKLARGGK